MSKAKENLKWKLYYYRYTVNVILKIFCYILPEICYLKLDTLYILKPVVLLIYVVYIFYMYTQSCKV